jgi:phosphatidylglycerol:prolipoprotein diacylglycerol transferase
MIFDEMGKKVRVMVATILEAFDIRRLSPSKLAILLVILGGALFSVLFYPISEVFRGRIILKQEIVFVENVILDFNSLGLGDNAESFGLDRELIVGDISVRYYSIFILLGILNGYIISLWLAKRQGIQGIVIDRLLIGLVFFGLVGARLFYVAFNLDLFSVNPLTIITDIGSGGMAIFGTIVFCLIYLWLYTIRFKFNTWEFLDIVAVGTLAGQIIGRWGNFFNYEAYGPETSVFWKMFVPDTANTYGNLNARFFHPTFLYEILLNYILLIWLFWNYERLTSKRTGLVFASYCIGYGCIRFFVEFFRLDALLLPVATFLQPSLGIFGNLENLRVSQLMSILLILIGIWAYFRRRKVLYLKSRTQDVEL